MIKRESFVASRAEVVVTPRVDYSGCARLLIAVIPGFLPKNHEVLVLEKLGLGVLLVGRFVRTIWGDVSWLVTNIACPCFCFNVHGNRRPWFRVARLLRGSLSQIRMPSILSAFGICQGSRLSIVGTLAVFEATVFVRVVDVSTPLLAGFAPTLFIGPDLRRIGFLSFRFRIPFVIGRPPFRTFGIPFITGILFLGVSKV